MLFRSGFEDEVGNIWRTDDGAALLVIPMRIGSKLVGCQLIERYWQMLNARAKGATLVDAGRSQAITRERVRQIEAKFLRLMRQHHKKKQPS